MPIKMICDRCGEETATNYAGERSYTTVSDGEWVVELRAHEFGGQWKLSVLCWPCLRRVLKAGVEQDDNDPPVDEAF